MRNLLRGAALSVALLGGVAIAEPFQASGDPPLNLNYQQVMVAEGLEHPWSIAWLPDGTALVTERPGRLRAIRNGRLDPTPIGGVPPVLVAPERGLVYQSGLFEVSPHPNFAQNRLLYITYAHGTATDNRLRLARATFDGQNLSNLQVLFETSQGKPDFQHYGGKILWLPDGTMLDNRSVNHRFKTEQPDSPRLVRLGQRDEQINLYDRRQHDQHVITGDWWIWPQPTPGPIEVRIDWPAEAFSGSAPLDMSTLTTGDPR